MNSDRRGAVDRFAPPIERLGLVAALSAALVKGMTTISGFPDWELDPFAMPAPSTGLGPGGSMVCDVVIIVGVLLFVGARWARGAVARLVDVALFVGGAVGVGALMLRNATIGDEWIGSAWLAAMALGLGASVGASRDEVQAPDSPSQQGLVGGLRGAQNFQATLAAVFLGFVALLAVRGVQQSLIEHPATLDDFKRNREAILAAQGWSADSPMAKAYERRLSQSEATGWFGLANVYATFAASGGVVALALFFGGVAAHRRGGPSGMPPRLLCAALLPIGAGIGGIVLAGGKGGVVAAALGVATALALMRTRPGWPKLIGGVVATGALAATFALVIGRGLVGDRVGELSILFRWFYMQAAVRIGADHLPFGVGPDGFQGGYMLAKNPLSPEDVTSSHNMLLDLFATLGLFGLAWAALWVVWIWRAGCAAGTHEARPSAPAEDSSDRAARWTVAAIGTIATFVAIRVDRGALSPDMAATRIIGLCAFCMVGWIVLALWARLDARFTRVALAAGAATGVAHGLIDVTGVWPGSCAMLGLLVGAAAGVGGRAEGAGARRLAMGLGMAALVASIFVAAPWRALPWERGLRDAAGVAKDSGRRVQRLLDLVAAIHERRPEAAEEVRSFSAALQVLTGRLPRSQGEFEAAVRDLDLRATRDATTKLWALAARYPTEWKVRREASRLNLREASILEVLARPHDALEARLTAERSLVAFKPARPATASEWAWLSLVRESLASGAEAQKWALEAATAMEEASKLNPYDLAYAVKLMRLWERAGDAERARGWARKALELDATLRYDREVKQLAPKDREDAQRLSGAS